MTNFVGSSVSMPVYDNTGIDNWSSSSPVVSSQSGTITTATGILRYRRSFNTVYINAEITITTNGTGSNSVLVTRPYTFVRTQQALEERNSYLEKDFKYSLLQVVPTCLYVTALMAHTLAQVASLLLLALYAKRSR